MKETVLAIDISSTNIKTALVAVDGSIVSQQGAPLVTQDEDKEGFRKIIDLHRLWKDLCACIRVVMHRAGGEADNLIALSSCAQRIAVAFLDENGEPIYAGPNLDVRGIDSAWIIEDAFEQERTFFRLTGRGPPLIFALSRLLWFREEAEESFRRIRHVLMLDDWIQFKLTGEMVSDPTVAAGSQLFDVKSKTWSQKILQQFELDPAWLPPLRDPASLTGLLLPAAARELGVPSGLPVIKAGADTQTGLVGMGCLEPGQIGISLGSTTPVMLITKEPVLDESGDLWTECHGPPGRWVLEANAGFTGKIYDWFKTVFLAGTDQDPDALMEAYLSATPPGAESAFALLGPERMNFNNRLHIRPGILMFPPPGTVSRVFTSRQTLGRAVLENIAYGIFENVQALQDHQSPKGEIFCAGRMAESREFLQLLCDVLGQDLTVPRCRESAFTGQLIHCLVGLGRAASHREALKFLPAPETFRVSRRRAQKYRNLYREWQHLKEKSERLLL